MKKTLKRLWASLIALILCFSMLMGATYAWFTDSATSSSNIIKSGKLDVEMYWSDTLLEADSADWKDADGVPIFTHENWEPGYTDVKYVKVVNGGDLSFKWRLSIKAQDEVTKLADVIDVYYVNPVAETVTTLEGKSSIGVLSEVIKNNTYTEGVLLPEGETSAEYTTGDVILAIAFHMHEDAGNEYQKLSMGDGFAISLIATQFNYEKDAFSSDYDKEAQWPDNIVIKGNSATADVVPTDDGKVSQAVSLLSEDGAISADIPEGVILEDGVNKLVLSISDVADSKANVSLSQTEAALSIDVHVYGVAENNDVVMAIGVKELLPVGLNMGNYRFYHVENGATVEMTLLKDGETPVHNSYEYDPATGDVVLHLKSFSEVALVADTENAWEGKFDYSWYDASKTDLTIANADQLAAFGAIVGGMNGQTKDDFSGKTVKLLADINLGDKESENNPDLIFYPIGYYNSTGSYEKTSGGSVTSSVSSFEGTFDGNGNTIANFYQNTWEMFGDYNDGYSGTPNHYKDAMGLFGYVLNGTVKNLTVKNFSSDGEFTPTGVIAAYSDGNSTFENIAITNCNPRVYNTGNGGIIGIAGDTNAANDDHITLKNITVDNSNKISALWGSYDVACGGLVGMYRGNVDGSGNATGDTISFENCHVSAIIDVYNDVCANYQYYAYRYSGMIIGSVRHNTKNAEGKVIPNMTGISATGCTVNYGDWNDYYYCEFEKNTMASYSEDYQFSRVPHSELKFTDSNGNGVVDADERASVTGCTHTHTAEENHQAIYLPFHQLFTGYSWGVSSIGLEKYSGIVTNLDITEGDQQESVVKFVSKFTGDFLYRVGNKNTVSIGSLFAAKDGVTISDAGVWVKVEAVDENSNVSGIFTPDTTDWTKGTIQFNGTGVVKVTIQDYNFCTPTELYLEVVDANNTITASFSGDTVLLNDVSASGTLSTSGVIYGNGFTVNMENAPISEKNGAVFHLYDGAVLKNLGIVGKEFTTVAMNVNDTNYGVSTVRAWGTVTIENCYISGCRSAVSVTGTELTIKDSVIANGVYANIDFRSGILNLHNVTTVNEPHEVNGTTVVGLGIVGNMTASAGRQINITGTLTQYNWVSKSDCENIKASGIDSIFGSVFTDSKYENLRYTYNGTTYVNTGILSLCSDFGNSAVTGVPSNYGGMNVTATISNISVDGYVWAPAKAAVLSDDDMKYHDTVYEWKSDDQGTSYIPSGFDFENAGLTDKNGVVQIEYESGSSYTLTAETIKKLFAATKYGQSLSYKVSMNGTDYTDKDVVFNASESQTYTIIFTITDNLVYDEDGNLTNNTYEVVKELKVFATVVDKGADAPTFTFYYGTNGSASAGTPYTTQPTNSYTSTIKQVGETYYIMPSVNATTANAIGSKTIDGETVYYPIVDGINVRSGSSTDYDFTRYYPIFKAVKISDNGTEYSYSGTKEMPVTVAWVSAEIDSGNGASSLNDGFGLYNNQYLCKIQKKAGDAEAGGTSVVKFSYTALDGNTYYYYVGFRFYDEDEGGLCVTPDTLVTLADGTQKRIDQVTYDDQLLVWNFYTGEYDVAPAAIIFDHGYGDNTVIKLDFSNGAAVKVVNMHQFFDATLNKMVTINADNVAQYVGHEFICQDGDGYSTVMLDAYTITNEYVEAWGIMSALHYNIIVEGIFSADFDPADLGLFNYFEIGENMKYDAEQMQADIEKYGLYTYEDFADYLTYDQFVAFNVQYFKISVEKGNYTFEGILALIDKYLNA